MKLGLIIKITNEGVPGETFSINKDEGWARYTEDVRTPIKELINFDGTEKVAYLVKFLGKDGYLICIIKARPEGSGRANDNTAAWIHIPAIVDIPSSVICNILKDVENAISGEKGTNFEQLKTLFAQEYSTKDVLLSAVEAIVSKSDSFYAVRYYNGDFTLNELLGPSIAQQEYGKYKGIMFVDKKQGIEHNSKYELTFEPQRICRYEPPTLIDGFTPCFPLRDKYQPFNKTIEIPENSQVTIHWVKNGYAVIRKSFLAGESFQYPDSIKISPNEYKIIVKRDHFHIYNPNNAPVQNPEIIINGVLMDGDSMEISESVYNEGVCLHIRAKGLADYNEKEKLTRNMRIFMKHKYYHYDFEIPLYDGEEKIGKAPFFIETHHKLKHCPIKGYMTSDYSITDRGTNKLYIEDGWKTKIKYFLSGVVSTIAVLLLIAAYNALDSYEFQFRWPPIKEIKHTQASNIWEQNNDQGQSTESANTDLTDAVKYLSNNEAWHKDSLNLYEATRGLFEELNSFDVSALEQRSSELINGSEKLSDLVSTLRKYIDDQKNPHIGKENNGGNYNSSDDNIINVGNYKKWLSEEHSPYVAPTDPVDKTKGQKSKITGEKKETSTVNVSTESGQQSQSGTKRGRLPQ